MIQPYKDEDEKYSVWELLSSFGIEMKDVMKHLTVDGFMWRHGDKVVYKKRIG